MDDDPIYASHFVYQFGAPKKDRLGAVHHICRHFYSMAGVDLRLSDQEKAWPDRHQLETLASIHREMDGPQSPITMDTVWAAWLILSDGGTELSIKPVSMRPMDWSHVLEGALEEYKVDPIRPANDKDDPDIIILDPLPEMPDDFLV